MSTLYPRLPQAVAEELFASASTLEARLEHPSQIFAPVGGHRASSADVGLLAESVRGLAQEFGYPDSISRATVIQFDRRIAELLVAEMDLSWSEAASRDVWSFTALIALPDVTRWRFGTSNPERWIGSDLTRHTWARAWWRGTVFAGRPDLLDRLTESDLNQILERRAIGGDPRLAVTLADALVNAPEHHQISRRALIRDAAARLRRRLAFVDPRAMDDVSLSELCASQIEASISSLAEVSARAASSEA